MSNHPECEIGLNTFMVQVWDSNLMMWRDVYAKYCPSCGIEMASVLILGFDGELRVPIKRKAKTQKRLSADAGWIIDQQSEHRMGT